MTTHTVLCNSFRSRVSDDASHLHHNRHLAATVVFASLVLVLEVEGTGHIELKARNRKVLREGEKRG